MLTAKLKKPYVADKVRFSATSISGPLLALLNMLVRLNQHLLRRGLARRVHVQGAKLRIKLLQCLLLRLRVAGVHQDRRKDVECHKNKVRLGTDAIHGNRPHLAYNDGAQRGTGCGQAESLGAAVGREDFRGIDPCAWSKAHAV